MNGLPHAQLEDYLLIAIAGTVLGGIIVALLTGRIEARWQKLVAGMAAIVAFGLIYNPAVRMVKEFLQTPPTAGVHDNASRTLPTLRDSTPWPSPNVTTDQPHPEPKGPAKLGVEDAFVRDYVAVPAKDTREPGQWAVVIADPDTGGSSAKLAATSFSVISDAGDTSVAIFRPSITRQPGFRTLYEADPVVARRLASYCDWILVARVTSTTKENPNFAGLLSLTMTLDGKIISTRTGNVDHQFQLSQVGAGDSAQEARGNAENAVANDLRAELHKFLK